MSRQFQLQIIRNSLRELGFPEVAAQLDAEARAGSDSPTAADDDVPDFLRSRALAGDYTGLVTRLTAVGDGLAFSNAFAAHVARTAASPVPGLAATSATVMAYLVQRTAFLELLVAAAHASLSELLVPGLQEAFATLAAVGRPQDAAGVVEPAVVRTLSPAAESALLLPLALGLPIDPHRLEELVFSRKTHPGGVPPGGPDPVRRLRQALANAISGTAHDGLTPPATLDNLPLAYLLQVLALAARYQRLRARHYLPPRMAFTANAVSKQLGVEPVADEEPTPPRVVHTLGDHTDEVWFARFLPLGRLLVTGSLDGTLVVYDVAGGFRAAAVLDANTADPPGSIAPATKLALNKKKGVIYCCWDPHEHYLVSCLLDTVVRVWHIGDVTAHRVTRSMESPTFRLLACFTLGENIRTWLCEFLPHRPGVRPHFIVGSPDKVLRAYTVDGEQLFDFYGDSDEVEPENESQDLTSDRNLQFNRINDLAVTPNGRFLVTANNDRQLHFYLIPDLFNPTSTTTKLALVALNGRLTSCSILADGKLLLLSIAPDELQVWDIGDLPDLGRPFLRQKLTGHLQASFIVRSCFGYLNTFSGQEELALSGSDDGYVYVWKLATGQLVSRVKGHHGLCNSVDWNRFFVPARGDSIDLGTYWCLVGDDKLVKVWAVDPSPD